MRILHVVASYLPARRYGGTIVSVHGLCAALAARGHDVHVFTTSVDGAADSGVPHGQPVTIDGVKVWYFRASWLRRIYRAPDLGAALDRDLHRFDVVHTHAVFLWPLWRAARAAARAGVPYVLSPRGMMEMELVRRKSTVLKSMWIGAIERRNLEGARAIHVTSRREADELAAFGFSLPPVIEIPNGVDEAPLPAPVMSPQLTAAVGGEPFVLFLGRIEWKKGMDRLIDGLALSPRARLVIAGNDEDGYQRVLEARAVDRGVQARVRFIGPVFETDKWALLAAAKALALTSYSENFGNVVLEALASSCPVLLTEEVGLAPEVGAAGVGDVVDGSASAIAAALDRLLTDDARTASMRERAREFAASYSWSTVAGQMEQLYDDVRR